MKSCRYLNTQFLFFKTKIPTILVTAHYDALGLATCLSYGCDSAGSGVVALLETARIFSALYSSSKTIPNVNILFVLTAEGKFNYYGLKKWIEEQSETNESKYIDLETTYGQYTSRFKTEFK